MASKQAKRRSAAKQPATLNYREFAVRATTVNADERSVETVIATETPVPMLDWERWELIPEVLRADGAILADQVPLLDSHQRHSMENQFGSTRNIQRRGSEIVGRLFFSSDEASKRAFEKVREGHATDVSAGYQVLEKTFVPRGQKGLIAGREYTGPVNVVTKWRLREVSLTPIGADEQAKLRGFDPSQVPNDEGFEMNEQLRKLLESRGMPKDLSDDDAQLWVVNNPGKLADPERKAPEVPPPREFGLTGEEFKRAIDEAAAAAVAKAAEQAVAFRSMVDTLLKIADREDLRERAYACATREQVEKLILDSNAERQAAGMPRIQSIKVIGESSKRLHDALGTALAVRAIDAVASPTDSHIQDEIGKRRAAAVQKVLPDSAKAKGWEEYRHASPYKLAEIYVRNVYGIDPDRMTREEVAGYAMFGPQRAAEHFGRRDEGAYHTTGSFANLTLDAINKSMQLGYTEAPSTWEAVMRRGTPAQDFKQLHRLRLGAIPNLPLWADNRPPETASFADARESYAVEARSLTIDFSYRLLVNDDMDALSRVPGQMGQAARRTVNAVAWSAITSNPTMSDSVALFAAATGARKRTNLTTGAGAPSTTTLQTLTNLMMQMRGENTPEGNESADILNLMPRYLVGPTALRTTIMQLVMSVYDSAATGSLLYNMASQLTPIIEPLLDSNSTTAWYLFADPGQIDTVEVTFLQGQETPVTRQELDFGTLSQKVTIMQCFAAKPLNHRGMQKHAGA